MKSLTKLLFFSLLLFTYYNNFGQAVVALTQIQIYSSTHPNAAYWHLPTDISPFEKNLDSGIFKELNVRRLSNFLTVKKNLTKLNQVGKLNLSWDTSPSTPYHAYLSLFEIDPSIAYQKKLVDIDEQKKDSIQSIWAVSLVIFNEKKDKIFQKSVMMGLKPVQTIGIGYPNEFVATTPNHLFQVLAKGVGLIRQEMNDMEFLTASVPQAFTVDNFWMPLVHNQPRVLFDTSQQFISYSASHQLQYLRIPQATLLKIDLKNKNSNNPFKDIVTTIKKTRSHPNLNEYYQIIQPLRDVYHNKDYLIKAYLEYNSTLPINEEANPPAALSFINETSNTIYDGNDSVGNFIVKELDIEPEKFIYPYSIYNGYDSSQKYIIEDIIKRNPIIHSRNITGKLYQHSFSILYDLNQSLKTIIVDKKVIMIVNGEKKPKYMITLPNSLDTVYKNLLLLIAYGELFQNPT